MHKAEQILDAVVANLTGLATTGDNIKRGRVAPLDDAKTAAISVYTGPDVPVNDSGWHEIQSVLTVYVDCHAKSNDEQIDQILNRIREEITVAMWADYQQGLSFIEGMNEDDAEAPDIDGEGGYVTGRMRTTWIFTYTRNRFDPSI